MMSHTRKVTLLCDEAALGVVAGRSDTDSTGEGCFLNGTILISFRLQYESQRVPLDRSPSKRRAFP